MMIKFGCCLFVLIGLAGGVHAQPVPEPDPSPPPVPPAVPAPPEIDPLAATMTLQAHSSALRGDCDVVERFAYRVRTLDPDLYRTKFATDPVIIACDPRPARETAVDAPRGRYHDTGFTFALALAVGRAIDPSTQSFSGQPASLPIAPMTRGSFGYQGDRVTIGLQIQFGRESRTDSSGTTPITASATTVLFGPTLRAQLWQNRTARAELVFAADLGFGEVWTSLDPDPNMLATSPSNLHVVVRGGFGLRYWLAPSFAVAVTSMLGVEYLEINQTGGVILDTGGSVNTVDSTTTSIDTALELAGVF